MEVDEPDEPPIDNLSKTRNLPTALPGQQSQESSNSGSGRGGPTYHSSPYSAGRAHQPIASPPHPPNAQIRTK